MERDPWAALVADMEKAVNQTVPAMRREFREVLDQVGALKGMVRGLRARVEVLDKDLPGILGKLEAQAEQLAERLTEVGISSPQTPPEDMADLVRYIVRAAARAVGVRPGQRYNAAGGPPDAAPLDGDLPPTGRAPAPRAARLDRRRTEGARCSPSQREGAAQGRIERAARRNVSRIIA